MDPMQVTIEDMTRNLEKSIWFERLAAKVGSYESNRELVAGADLLGEISYFINDMYNKVCIDYKKAENSDMDTEDIYTIGCIQTAMQKIVSHIDKIKNDD